MRKIAAFVAVATLGLGLTAGATREPVPGPDREAASAAPSAAVRPAEGRDWVGRYCTPAGCARAPAKSWSTLIGFGAAALGAGFLGRRRNPQGA